MRITILGAHGQIASIARKRFLKDTDVQLVLTARNAQRLEPLDASRESALDVDATDVEALENAIKGSDVVYANLAGANMEDQAKAVVAAMDAEGVKRLVWISSIGVYDEVPGAFGKWNNEVLKNYLPPYKRAVEIIEKSDLDYTIVRPAWLTNKNEVEYETTLKGQAFKGTEVSRASIADFVLGIVKDPTKFVRQSVGVDKPGTDGDKPSWY
jgi:uncharacterized protein YbjT (DUF2867 family)